MILGKKWQARIFLLANVLFPHPTRTTPTKKQRETQNKTKQNKMELTVRTFGKRQYAIEVGEDDTTEKLREKVASTTGLCEDDFHMKFGGEKVEDIAQLSAGDTVVLTEAKAKKYEAIAALHALGERDITAARLQVVTGAEVATLLLQAEVATAIPDYFFQHSAVTSIDFSNASVVDVIGNRFLLNCTSLTAVNLSGLSAVSRIENHFLTSCPALTTVDLSSLRSVTTIGAWCLANCTALTAVNLSGLSVLTRIEDYFLYSCPALTTVDISSLRSVTGIGECCLTDCTALTAVNMSGLSVLTSIEDYFLASCSALRTVNLTGLRAVTTIGASFMYECTALTTAQQLTVSHHNWCMESSSLHSTDSSGHERLVCTHQH